MALRFLTQAQLMAHCKADSDSTDDVTPYGEAAEASAERYLNRTLFPDKATLAAAVAAAQTAISTAQSDYATAAKVQGANLQLLSAIRDQAMVPAILDLNGLVINSAIISGMLMNAAHLWSNRTDVVTGQYGAAQAVPLNSQWIYDNWRMPEGTI